MTAPPTFLPLHGYTRWIRETDEHAESHLALLEQAERLLADSSGVPAEDRRLLAAKLERWRYQHLGRRPDRLTPTDRELADALDLAGNELAGRPPRPPRRSRAAIGDSSLDGAALVEATTALDPQVGLDEVVQRASRLTQEHFRVTGGRGCWRPGRWRVLLYAPLYVSNYCVNHCRYCGFRHPNPIPRRHLSVHQALEQAEILRGRGLRHILLVAGDFPSLTTTEYFVEIIRALRAGGIATAVEIAPQTTAAYAELGGAGACGVTLYQETYDELRYARYHPRGTKVAFDWRLEGLERAAEAGMQRLGLGILLGLADPREDLLALLRHARYLETRFPGRTLALSLPRIYDAPDGFSAPFPVDDETFVRLYCALRIAFPHAELVISTRERPELRNRLATICITQMSAGSCTSPGGYEVEDDSQEAGRQFPVCDHRSPAEVASWLGEAGFEVAWSIV
jgi:2-iminoacetate synthase